MKYIIVHKHAGLHPRIFYVAVLLFLLKKSYRGITIEQTFAVYAI
jgi:hypothetical protein